MKESPINYSFADGRVSARVRLMVRGRCLSVRGSESTMIVVVDLWKQICMCYLNALYMKEKDGEGM